MLANFPPLCFLKLFISFPSTCLGAQAFLLPTLAEKAVYLLWSLGGTTQTSWNLRSWEGHVGPSRYEAASGQEA